MEEEDSAELILAALEGLRAEVGEFDAVTGAMDDAEICTAMRLEVAVVSVKVDEDDEKIADPGGDEDAAAFFTSSVCAALVAGGFLKLQIL